MAASVTQRVVGEVTGLAVSRDGDRLKASWRIPGYMTDQNRPDRAEWLDAEVDFERENSPREAGEVWSTAPGSAYPGPPAKTLEFTGYDYNWVKGLALNTSLEKPYDRGRFHPLSPGRYCRTVRVGVHGGNSSGVGGWDEHSLTASGRGPIAWATYDVRPPRAPSISWSYDQASARATVTVRTDAGGDQHERYDTMVMVSIRRQDGSTATDVAWTSTQLVEWTRTIDLSRYITGLQSGKHVTVTCRAYARGMAGDNPAQASAVAASCTVAMPSAATLGTVTCDRKAAAGRIMVPVTVGAWTTGVQLQRRHGTSGSWQDVAGATDDGDCRALYDSYGAADPELGEYVYYRVKSTRDGYAVYSEAKRADAIYTAKPPLTCNATVGIASVAPSPAGTSAAVVMGYSDATANAGTELSWSADPAAWNSTSGPSTATFTGDDPQRASSRFSKTRTVTISGLEQGGTYYVRCRRYRTAEGETVFSGYSQIYAFTTESAEDDSCAVAKAEPAGAGTGATLTIGIDEDNPNTGTQVEWSTYEHAWTSNASRESLEADWAPDASPQAADWPKTQTVHLVGLEPGTTYYVRCRRYLTASSRTTYGAWSPVAAFTTPSGGASEDVRCGIVSVEPGEDGRSAKVVVGFDGSRTGNELTWSANPDAWESSDRPQALTFSWADDESQSEAWSHTATAYLSGLEDGTTYYVRARGYYQAAGAEAWSGYTDAHSVTPVSAPASVVLAAPATVARGEAVEAYWTIEGPLAQAEWHIHPDGEPNVSIAEGSGTLCRATIPAERYAGETSLAFYVEAGCGGGLTASNVVTVGIADAPSCEARADAVLAAQPATFEACTDDPTATLLATCRALGVTVSAPDGSRDQLAGAVMWTAALAPAWREATWADTAVRADLELALAAAEAALAAAQADAGATADDIANAQAAVDAAQAAVAAHPADGAVWTAEVEMPPCDFMDGGAYELECKCVEQVAGLTSPAATCGFSVAWAHQAPEPSPSISVVPDAESRSVAVAFAAPPGAASGDVYDLYRKLPTGYALVASGLALDDEVLDPYAPFGRDADLSYRVCCRTADGDMEFADFGYEMDVNVLRFDWNGEHVELPYELEYHDSYSKSYASRAHAEGGVCGYFERAVEMDGGYDFSMPMADGLQRVNLVRSLGEYPGAAFCRTQHGMAFQCNAQVSDLGLPGQPPFYSSRVSVSAMAMTDEFAAKGGRGAGE